MEWGLKPRRCCLATASETGVCSRHRSEQQEALADALVVAWGENSAMLRSVVVAEMAAAGGGEITVMVKICSGSTEEATTPSGLFYTPGSSKADKAVRALARLKLADYAGGMESVEPALSAKVTQAGKRTGVATIRSLPCFPPGNDGKVLR